MAYNGSGTFQALPPPTYPAVAGEVIYAARFNAVIQDLIDGLSQCLVRDGQAAVTGNINMNGFKFTSLAAATVAGHAIEYAQWLAGFTNPPVHPEVDTLTDGTATTEVINGTYLETALIRAALNAGLPGQGGNAGKFIKTDGTNASWATIDTSDLSGTFTVEQGATGLDEYAAGDLIYASAATVLARLAAAASGSVLKSGATPSWGKVALSTDVSGTLPVANGGTGTTTSTGTGATVRGTQPTLDTPTLNNTDLTGVKQVGFTEYDNGNSGTAKTVTLSNGQKQKLTLTGNLTLTISFTNARPGNYQLRLIQDGTGGRTLAAVSGLSSSRWLGSATQPPHNTAVAGETILSIYYDGTNAVQSMVKVGAV